MKKNLTKIIILYGSKKKRKIKIKIKKNEWINWKNKKKKKAEKLKKINLPKYFLIRAHNEEDERMQKIIINMVNAFKLRIFF